MNRYSRSCRGLFLALALWPSFQGAALALPTGAPPAFDWNGRRVVPVDFHRMTLRLRFDAAARRATGEATIELSTEENGYPLLDMAPRATAVRLNGESLDASVLREISDPSGLTKLRVLDHPVFAHAFNRLEIQYEFPDSQVTYTGGGVRMGMFMGDVNSTQQRGFLEKFAPANLEFDAFQLDLEIEIVNATGSRHEMFTNGEIVSEGGDAWRISFPPYFTASSFYVHVSNRGHSVESETFSGLSGDIPVTVYAESASLADRGMTAAKRVLSELESTYGAFAHDRIVAYITASGGGMEYCGATITSLGALEHEFTHFWFARGVMPANGNAGWIDEAIASWRDNGYPTQTTLGASGPNLGGFPAFQRMTTMDAYGAGARLMAHFNHLFRSQGGLRPVIRELFAQRRRQTITTPEFQQFLQSTTGVSLDAIFRKHVFGQRRTLPARSVEESPLTSGHPRPFTEEELIALR